MIPSPATPLQLQSLPLFPLQSVLFPGGLLALRVFEVRYLDLIARCQRTSAPFGVVCLTQGQEVRVAGAQPERFEAIGTLASITQMEPLQPGLLAVQSQGGQRFRIQHSQRLPHGLWSADVAMLPDDQPLGVPPELQHTAQALLQLQRRIEPDRSPAQPVHCGWVANRWAELLPLPLPVKQSLMALDSPLLRLELVADLLETQGISAPNDKHRPPAAD